jgi:hypothetical protein
MDKYKNVSNTNRNRFFATDVCINRSNLKKSDVIDVQQQVEMLREKPAKIASDYPNTKPDIVTSAKLLTSLIDTIQSISTPKLDNSIKTSNTEQIDEQKEQQSKLAMPSMSGLSLF